MKPAEKNESDKATDEREETTDAARPKESRKVDFETILPREEAVSYFEAVVAGLKKGSMQLKQGEECLTLTPTAQVTIEVKASRKGDKERISFELGWRAPSESDFKITSN